MLVNQVLLLQRKFTYCKPTLVARNDIKYAFKLAREAIDSQVTRSIEENCGKTVKETCVICLEDSDFESMFSVDGCMHRYCFSCMKQHVEVKLLQGMMPKCPHEGCKSELIVDSCRKFLTPKMIETLKQRIKEASIPVTEKVYCPHPRCSTLMSRREVSEYAKDLVDAERSGVRKCLKCHGLFCINCRVPWHSNMTCQDYKRKNPNPPAEDLKLKSLATRNLWRQCVKCNHIIELSEGCFHMTCRYFILVMVFSYFILLFIEYFDPPSSSLFKNQHKGKEMVREGSGWIGLRRCSEICYMKTRAVCLRYKFFSETNIRGRKTGILSSHE